MPCSSEVCLLYAERGQGAQLLAGSSRRARQRTASVDGLAGQVPPGCGCVGWGRVGGGGWGARGQYWLRLGREGHGLGQVELDDAAAARHDLGQLDLLAALDDVAVAHLQYLAEVDDVAEAGARAVVVPVTVEVGL